jgi:hypothetical protein
MFGLAKTTTVMCKAIAWLKVKFNLYRLWLSGIDDFSLVGTRWFSGG